MRRKEFRGPANQQGWFAIAAAAVTAIGAISSADTAKNAAHDANVARGSAEDIAQQELDLARQADARSQAMFDRYMEVYAPLEDQLIKDAQEGLDVDEELGLASASVNQAHAQAKDEMTRDMARYGIGPNDGRMVEANRMSALDKTKGLVGARTSARRYVDEENFRRRGAVATLGRNLPGAAGAFAAQAGAGLSDVGDRYTTNANNADALAAGAGQSAGIGLGQLAMILNSMNSGTPGASFGMPPADQQPLPGTIPTSGGLSG